MSKPAGYYDWDFRQRKAYDDAQVEKENAEYEAEQARRSAERAAGDARRAREHAKTEIHGWEERCNQLSDEVDEIADRLTTLVTDVRGQLALLRKTLDESDMTYFGHVRDEIAGVIDCLMKATKTAEA